MAAETLTLEQELAATRMDLWCATSRLSNVAYWMRVHARIPHTASVWYAHCILQQRAEKGDETAVRKLREFDEAATAYEGARVAVAILSAIDPDAEDASRAVREAVADYLRVSDPFGSDDD